MLGVQVDADANAGAQIHPAVQLVGAWLSASLRLAPSYAVGEHITLSLEGKASFALSTLDTKTGEKWELTPMLRFQAEL